MTDKEASKILKIAREHADNYRRAVSEFSDETAIDCANAAANAASNTAWLILREFGYSTERMRELMSANQ